MQDLIEEKYFLEKERIGPFIGQNGEFRKKLEEKFNLKIDINSENGEVVASGADSVNLFILSNIVSAVNLGHNPEKALKLEDENYVFDIIDVKTMLKDHSKAKSVMGRIIGKEGSTRKVLEDLSNCAVSVQDHFVSVIGPYENIEIVHEALKMLISGASHKTFYSFLERNRTQMDTGLL